MGFFSNGPFVLLCLLIVGSAEEYSTEEKLKYKICDNYVQVGFTTGDLKPMTFWHVNCRERGYFSVGDVAVQGKRTPQNLAIIVKDENNGLLQRPKDFREIWRNPGINRFRILEMECKLGFKALGNIVVSGSKRLPDLRRYRCVSERVLVRGTIRPIWEEIGIDRERETGVWEVIPGKPVQLYYDNEDQEGCGKVSWTLTKILWTLVGLVSDSIHAWTFIFGTYHNIHARTVYVLNQNKLLNTEDTSIQLRKKMDAVCGDSGSTQPSASFYPTIIPWPTVTPKPTTHPSTAFCNDRPEGNYAYPPDPHKYYICSNGNTVIMNCPEGLVYVATKDTHNLLSNILIKDGFCKDKPNGNYSYPEDPFKYYSCCNGNTKLKNCPEDQIFIIFEHHCSWPRRSL